MTEFISRLIGNDAWASVIVSFIPLIELKGGILFARSAGFDFITAFLLAYAGSTAAFFLVYFLLKPILALLKKIKIFNTFALKVEDYFKAKAESTENSNRKGILKGKSEKFIKIISVFIFVAIPLPLTGVWTGTAVAVFFGLKFKDTVLPVAVGNFVAGLLISLLATLCEAINFNLDYLLWGLLGLAAILFVVFIVKVARRKPVSDTQIKGQDKDGVNTDAENK